MRYKPHLRLVNGIWCAFMRKDAPKPVAMSKSFKSLCYVTKRKFNMLDNRLRQRSAQ